MDKVDLNNLILFLLVISLYAKFYYHFSYLKKTNNKIKAGNLFSFGNNIENLFYMFHITIPVFFSKGKSENPVIEKARTRTKFFVVLSWLIFIAYIVNLALNRN